MPHAFLLPHALLPAGFAQDVRIVVDQGLIVSVEPGQAGEARRLAGIAVPGLPNLHSHAFQRGMAGLGERRGQGADSFWTWREVMYRFLARLSPDDVEAIAAFAYVEMLERGFTTVGEFHYLHNDIDGLTFSDPAEMSGRIVAAAEAVGIGLTLLPAVYVQGGFGGRLPHPGQVRFVNDLDAFGRLLEGARAHASRLPGARVGIAPHSLRAVDPSRLRAVEALAPDGPIHIHAAEQVAEVEECVAATGKRPVRLLLDHGIDARWCLVHATQMLPEETLALAGSGAVAGLCPITEASLGDGVFDGLRFLNAGGRFGIGSDSNVDIDAAGELRQLEYSQRLIHRGRNLMTTQAGESTGHRLLVEALAGGAQALAQPIGRIEAGCRADIVVLDFDHPAFAASGQTSWLDAWLFAGGRDAVSTVVCGGQVVVERGRHVAREAVAARYRATMRQVMQQ